MRLLAVAALLVAFAAAPGPRQADAHDAIALAGPAPAILRGEAPPAADDGDDDTVAVQLVVLGIVIATVFVLGTAGYALRWKLGRTAYTPPADSGHH